MLSLSVLVAALLINSRMGTQWSRPCVTVYHAPEKGTVLVKHLGPCRISNNIFIYCTPVLQGPSFAFDIGRLY